MKNKLFKESLVKQNNSILKKNNIMTMDKDNWTRNDVNSTLLSLKAQSVTNNSI